MRKLSTAALAWTTLVATWLLIVQGAVVRATGSGAGCGSHWPTCNGEVIPLAHSTASLIEFSHRLLSLVILAFGSWLLVRALRERRDNPGLFIFAAAAFVFLIFEALLGAATVLLGLTGDNVSVGRGLMVASHLVNSLLLVGTSSIAAVYAGAGRRLWPLRLSRQGLLAGVLAFGLAGMLVLMFSGGIAAMGDTMFPVDSLQAGLTQDFSPNAHLMVRLRVLHPLIALVVGVYLFVSLGLAWWMKPVPAARRLARLLFGVYVAQLLLGAVNWWFLAPIVLQLLHLSTATLAFALLAALSVTALGGEVPATGPVPRSAATEPAISLRAPGAKKEV